MYCSNLSTTALEGERASDRAASSPLKIQSLDNERIIGRGGGGGVTGSGAEGASLNSIHALLLEPVFLSPTMHSPGTQQTVWLGP